MTLIERRSDTRADQARRLLAPGDPIGSPVLAPLPEDAQNEAGARSDISALPFWTRALRAAKTVMGSSATGTSYAMYAGVILLWGAAWFAISLGVGAVQAEVSVFYRFALSGALLALFCSLRGDRMRFSAREHGWLCAQGALMFGINYVLFYRAIEIVPSGVVAVIYSTIVLMNVLFGALVNETRLHARTVVGGILGLTGVIFINAPAGFEIDHGVLGLLLALAGTVASSLSQLTAARNLRVGMPLLPNMAYSMFYGSMVTLAYCVFAGRTFNFDLSSRYIASLAYLVLFASLAGFGLYLALVRRLGPDRVAYASVLYPIVALLLSSAFESFQWTTPIFVGVGVALLGNIVVLSRARKPRAAARAADTDA